MIGDLSQFVVMKLKSKGYVTYGDNNRKRIIERGDIGTEASTIIKDVLYVEGLKHNLVSISQLFYKGYKVKFEC